MYIAKTEKWKVLILDFSKVLEVFMQTRCQISESRTIVV